MNANLPQQMLAVKDWVFKATKSLEAIGITSARLDAEIILAHTLHKSRTHLHAHDNEMLTARQQEIADARLSLRLDRVPVAYIIGHKDFYGRRFSVTTATLIPRPESEDIIEALRDILPDNVSLFESPYRVVDVGTGSGCLGITVKKEFPDIDVTLLDISPHALKIAASNATSLEADVRILKSDLLQSFPFRADVIIANLPYVDSSWERSEETNHEPGLALFAEDGGTALIKKLIDQSTHTLPRHGYLVLEADPTQHDTIELYAKKKGFEHVKTIHYVIVLQYNR